MNLLCILFCQKLQTALLFLSFIKKIIMSLNHLRQCVHVCLKDLRTLFQSPYHVSFAVAPTTYL